MDLEDPAGAGCGQSVPGMPLSWLLCWSVSEQIGVWGRWKGGGLIHSMLSVLTFQMQMSKVTQSQSERQVSLLFEVSGALPLGGAPIWPPCLR